VIEVDVDPRRLPLSDYRPVRAIRTTQTSVVRAAVPAVDVHNHLGRWLTADGGWMCRDVGALLTALDRCNVAHVVNLDGRWGSELRDNLERYDEAHPGRFSTFCQVDWSVLSSVDGGAASGRLVAQLRESAMAGAKGLKVWKDLGLTVRDSRDALVLPDDPRVAPVFAAAGELGLPVLIHVADPVAFFQPLDERNERLEELAANPDWWFGRTGLPAFDRLIDALESVVAAHPGTTFIGAHVGCAAEDLARVSRLLSAYPNLHIDLGGRMAELGRQPRAARRLVLDHPEQVLFGTDQFPVDEAEYHRWFRFLESADECFSYAPEDEAPPSGRWDVSALDLPASALPGLYAANAWRLLGA
jgi:Amidohydrolase